MEKFDIRLILEEMLEKGEPVSKLVDTIIEFSNKFENKIGIRIAFMNDNFCKIGEKLELWSKEEFFDLAIEETQENAKTTEEFLQILKMVLESDKLTEDEKNVFLKGFAKGFGECSEDEECCLGKVCIVVRNLSPNEDFIKNFNSYEEAIENIAEIYESCSCDDIVLAESVWFPILCKLQQTECEDCKNFTSYILFER